MRVAAFVLACGATAALLLEYVRRLLDVAPLYVSTLILAGCAALAYVLYSMKGHARSAASQERRREQTLQTYAASVASSLESLYGRACAFVLLASPVEQKPPTVQYISNLNRAEGRELLGRLFSNWAAQDSEPGQPVAPGSNEPSFAPASEAPAVPLDIDIPSRGSPASWQTQMLEFTHDAVIIWEMDGAGVLYWNRAAERLYGYERSEAHGKVTHNLLKTQPSGSGIAELESKLARYGVWVGELHHTARNAKRIHVESRLALISQEGGRWLVLEVNRDITDRYEAQQRSLETQQQLSHLRSRVNADS